MSVGEALVDGNGDTPWFLKGSSGLIVDELHRHGTLIGLLVAMYISYSLISKMLCFMDFILNLSPKNVLKLWEIKSIERYHGAAEFSEKGNF